MIIKHCQFQKFKHNSSWYNLHCNTAIAIAHIWGLRDTLLPYNVLPYGKCFIFVKIVFPNIHYDFVWNIIFSLLFLVRSLLSLDFFCKSWVLCRQLYFVMLWVPNVCFQLCRIKKEKNFFKNSNMKLGDSVVKSFRVAKVFRDNSDRINSIDFSPNGESLISASDDDSIVIYDCANEGK